MNNYQAWEVDDSKFPTHGSVESRYAALLEYGILAPSTHNTQPWRFESDEKSLFLYPDRNYELSYGDSENRGLFISLGCCLINIMVAAEHFGMPLQATIRGSGNNIFLQLVQSKTKSENSSLRSLFPGIKSRTSNKLPYSPKVVAPNILKKLTLIPSIHLEINKRKIEEIANLHSQTAAEYAMNKAFARELSNWLRYNKTEQGDGMPGFVSGIKTGPSLVGRYVIRFVPKVLKVLAKKDKGLIMSSATVGIITSAKNNAEAWIDVGKKYQQFALQATLLGLSSTPLAAMIEKELAATRLARLFEVSADERPQMFFRLGYPTVDTKHTPRREIKIGKYNANTASSSKIT